MGYRTDFQLIVKDDANAVILGDSPRLVEITQFFKEMEVHYDNDDHEFTLFGGFEQLDDSSFASRDGWKWYEHEEDMRKFSNKFQDVLFELRGEGEEWDDRWIKYFFNGKMQVCFAKITIEYPKFDLKRMK